MKAHFVVVCEIQIFREGEEKMSVILGKATDNIVILAADKRSINLMNGQVVSDDMDKLIIVNEHLAIACAGNAAIQRAIEIELDRLSSKEQFFVEDAIELISGFYDRVKSVNAKTILSTSAFFIIGGVNREGNIDLRPVSYSNQQLMFPKESETMALFQPYDVDIKICSEIYMSNFCNYTEVFVEKTVKEISELSAAISKCGDKWVYDNRSKLSQKVRF